MEPIFKIVPKNLWDEALKQGYFRGSADDLRDGFIHFSTIDQLEDTANRHFKGQKDLLLLSVAVEKLDDCLKYEVSRGGDLFPHLYGHLPLAAVIKVSAFDDDLVARFISKRTDA